MKFYSEYTIPDIGQGLNRFHSLDSVPDGMMFSLKNMDPSSNGQISTRRGFEQYYGCLPFRAKKFTKSGTDYIFELDNASTIDISQSLQGPLIISGIIPESANGNPADDFTTTFGTKYYSGYSVAFKELYPAGSPETITKSASATGVTQNQLFVGLSGSTSTSNLSNQILVPEEVRINKTTFEVQLDYTSPSAITGYFSYLEVPTETGVVYSEEFTGTSTTITGTTHNLNNGNFIIRCYDNSDVTNLVEVVPLEITSDSATSSITVTFPSSDDYKVIVYAAPNAKSDTAAAGYQELTIANVTDPFNFWQVWAITGSTKFAVTPASIDWDANTQSVTLGYYGPAGTESVDVYWKSADYVANSITVTGADNGADYTTDLPELTIWGLCHAGAYKSAAPQGGFSHHLDSYKSDDQEHMVTALGGNLFQAKSYADGATDYYMANLTARGANRVSTSQILAPLFSQTNTNRERGAIYDASVTNDFWATVTNVAYSGISGQTDYTFTFTNKTGTLVLGTQITASDYLTVRRCGRNFNNGTFKIVSVTDTGPTQVVIRVENSNITSNIFDESGIAAQGNVFTDRITLTADPIFVVGDKITSASLTNKTVVATDNTGNYLYIDSITSTTVASDGLNLFINRNTSVIPLVDGIVETVGSDSEGRGFVIGDSVTVTGLDNIPKVKYVNRNTSTTISVSVTSGLGTVNFVGHGFNTGQSIVLANSDTVELSNVFVITEVTNADEFTITTSAADGTYNNITLIGKTIEIDEKIDLVTGPTQITVTNQGRWTPVENPKSTADRANDTKVLHWDESEYTEQPYLRSVIVNDSMFLVNNKDEVKKYDGTNLVNAGLAPFQGWAFAVVEPGSGGLAQGSTVHWNNGSGNPNADGYFRVSSEIKVGEIFKSPNATYTVHRAFFNDDDSTWDIYTEEAIDAGDNSSQGDLSLADIYSYYIRFNLVDINRNIVASATLGSDDLKVKVFSNSSVNIKAVGMPAFQEVDHDRMEIELYRTKANTAGPFYRVSRKLVDYSSDGGYVTFRDSSPDSLLTQSNLDIGITVQELGNQWDRPPRSSALTTVDNRLIMANVTSPPTTDITFTGNNLDASDFTSGYCVFRKSPGTANDSPNNVLVYDFTTTSTDIEDVTDTFYFDIGSDNLVLGNNGAFTSASVGDWIYLFHSAILEGKNLDFSGWFRIHSKPASDSIEIKVSHSRTPGPGTINDVSSFVLASVDPYSDSGLVVPVFLGTDGNFQQLYENDVSIEDRASSRLSVAINAVTGTEPSDNPYWNLETPVPWLIAQGGRSFTTGALKVTRQDGPSDSFIFHHSGFGTDLEVFANNVLLPTDTDHLSENRLFNSRLIVSYPEYPEIVDNPFAAAERSNSVIDVNPADGQEITAVLPFFGQSAFGSANLSQAVVVFKTSSIYLVDVSSGQTQKLQSQGQGCTAPRSPALTKDGILFANESGIYKLDWNMHISWVGRMIKDLWNEDLNRDQIAEFVGHNYRQDRKYKLSAPLSGNNYPETTLVYDHTRETQTGINATPSLGSWTEYTDHNVTGWANQSKDSYFGNQAGQVMRIRNTGGLTDFRDDESAIANQELITGALSFGLPGNRKTVAAMTIQYQNSGTLTNLQVSTEQSLSGTFNPSTTIDLDGDNQTVRYSLPERKGTFLRAKLAKVNTKDEQLRLSKITFHVKDIGPNSVREAADV